MRPRIVTDTDRARVLEALGDHTMVAIVAAAAGFNLDHAIAILEALRGDGLVRERSRGCWERT